MRLARVGDGPEDTSQPQPRAVLTGLGEAETVDRILDVFTEDRLLSGNRATTSEAATVEVAHEALIRGWPATAVGSRTIVKGCSFASG